MNRRPPYYGHVPLALPSVRWIAISPAGAVCAWPHSRLRQWWRRRRGWVFYDGEGRLSR